MAITGDEYGEKLLPIAEQGPLYPLGGAPPFNRSSYWNDTMNDNNNSTTTNNNSSVN